MKKQFSFMIGFFIIGILFGGFFISYSYSSETQSLLDEVSNDLVETTERKTEEINFYFSKMEEDIQTLQESSEVKMLLEQDLVFDERTIKMDVDERARIITKEVENYIRAYPEMTLKDLQESESFQEVVIQAVGMTRETTSFQDIAVQPVGKGGYSFVFDSQSLINYFHKEPRRIGYDYNTMEHTFPELWSMFKETSEKGFSEGFYYRDEPDGTTSYKYGRFVQIPVKTADGISISVGTTAYVKDYKIVKGDSKNLESFNEMKDYYNLILVSSEGYVIYQTVKKGSLGTNLEWEVNSNLGFSKIYFNTKENNQVSFDGPFIRHYGEIYPKLFIMAPVYDESKLLGYIAIIDEMDEIFEISKEIVGIGETEESYLINDKKLLISPLTLEYLDILVQSINSENSENCFNETFPEHFERNESVSSFLDYRGEVVLGTHREIESIDWCLLTEVDKEEVMMPMTKFLRNRIIFVGVIILLLTLVGFFVGKYFDKEVKGEKIRKYPSEIKFLKDLKLRYAFLFALFFAAGYLFIVTSLFQGFQNAKLFDDIPDMLVFVVGFMIFIVGLKIRNMKVRHFILYGGLLICLRRMFDIPLQEYQLLTGNTLIIWVPVLAMELMGFLLILIGYRRLRHGI
jgi:hypothetical protein